VLLVVLIIRDPGRIDRRSDTLRRLTIVLIAIMTIGAIGSVGVLLHDIFAEVRGVTATVLLGRAPRPG
jgi:hypothetical protein